MTGMRLRMTALLLFCLPGCVSLRWSRENLNEPVAEEALEQLRPGEADLTRCLDALGAPWLVWEYKLDGMALAYAFVDSGGWGFRASYSPSRYAPSASFSYASTDDRRNGVVLLFDETLTLEAVRRGYLSDLVPDRRRPAPLPELLDGH